MENEEQQTTPQTTGEMIATLEPIKRLSRDLAKAATTLSIDEVRYLVDAYYQMQANRIVASNQLRALTKSEEPHEVLLWLTTQSEMLENQIKRTLDKWTSEDDVAYWCKQVMGIGPVIAAGLRAHIDIEKVETAGAIWRFAGLDPTSKWLPKTKRPWNASLKTLCVHPSCTVTTLRGHIPISDVEVGDMVLTHQGRWRKVLKTFVNHHKGIMHGLLGSNSGNQIAWLTPGHPVYAAQTETWRSIDRSGKICIKIKPNSQKPFDWHAVEAVKPGNKLMRPRFSQINSANYSPTLTLEGVDCGDGLVAAEGRWAGVPSPKATMVPRKVTIDADMMRLIGLYLAEGHITNGYVVWSFHEKEQTLVQFVSKMLTGLVGHQPTVTYINPNHSVQVGIGCKPLADALSVMFGTDSYTIRFPMEWLGLPEHLLKPLWQGIMEGDGDHRGYLKNKRISTCNGMFAKQCVDLGRRLGLSVSLHSEHTGKAFRVMINDRHDLEVSARSFDQFEYDGPVHNLEVEEDHSYVVEGYAVHNCWKLGESFVKVKNNPEDQYGHLYEERKAYESAKNEAGDYKEQAAEILKTKNIGKDTDAYKAYIQGKLPPGHIHARAKRYAVKLFLSHLFDFWYRHHYQKEPPKPFAIAILGHAHMLEHKPSSKGK